MRHARLVVLTLLALVVSGYLVSTSYDDAKHTASRYADAQHRAKHRSANVKRATSGRATSGGVSKPTGTRHRTTDKARTLRQLAGRATSGGVCTKKPDLPKCVTPPVPTTSAASPSPTLPTSTPTSAAPTVSPTFTPTAAPSSTATTSSTPTVTPTSTSPTSTPPAGSNVCTDANAYVNWAGERYLWIDDTRSPGWSNQWGNGGIGDYYADADMWAANGYAVRQKSVFCDHDSWYAEVTANNSANDGAVKTYPNVHRDFIDWNTGIFPSLSSFSSLNSTFAHKSPTGSGLIYNWSYDIWLGGVASPTGYEVMIWTENGHQLPFGSKVRSAVSIAGHNWDLWRTSDGSGLAFYPTNDAFLTSGSFDLKLFLTYLQSQGFVRSPITLGQIGYGVEVVSTGNVAQRFDVTDFSVTPVK